MKFLLIFLLILHKSFQLVLHSKTIRLFDSRSKLIPYQKAWNVQNCLVDDHISRQSSSKADLLSGSLLLLQHPSIYTLGTGTITSECGPFGKMSMDGRPLEYETLAVDRAGQATYHGPGQLVMYPVLDLTHFDQDIHWYLRSLEQVVIDTLASLDLESGRVDGLTGVWTTGRPLTTSSEGSLDPLGRIFKVAAMGIKIRRWVTLHGVSINVNPDMRYFDNIVPCGIRDKKVGTISQFQPHTTVDDVATLLLHHFRRIFNVEMTEARDNELPSIAELT